MAEKTTASIGDVAKFFGTERGGLTKFRAEWAELTDQDKQQIKDGIFNGTLTY